jgi:hypothetical protein
MKYLAVIQKEFVKSARTFPNHFIDMLVEHFLKSNPNPESKDVQDWADRNHLDINKVQESLYRLATLYVREK